MNTTPSQAKGETAGEEKPSAETPATRELQSVETGDALRESLEARGLNVEDAIAKIEARVVRHFREHPLPCFFPSCVSKFDTTGKTSMRVEEAAGGFVAECEACCGGTGSFGTWEEAIDEWNAVARLAQRASLISAPPTPPQASVPLKAEAIELLRTWLMHYAGRCRTDDPLLLEETRAILAPAQDQPAATEEKEKPSAIANPESEGAANVQGLAARVEQLEKALRDAPEPICLRTPLDTPYDAPHTVRNFAAIDKWWIETRRLVAQSEPLTSTLTSQPEATRVEPLGASSLSTTPKATSEDTKRIDWIEQESRKPFGCHIAVGKPYMKHGTAREAIDFAMKHSAPHQPVGEEGEAKAL